MESLKDIVIEEYEKGYTPKEISENNNISIGTIYKHLRVYKGKRFSYHDYTEEQRNDIKEKYLSGVSCPKIGEEYGVSHKVIGRVLDDMGIPRDGRSHRKYALDEHYMDNIDTPEKAYVLGFFFADGSVNVPKQTVAMSLQEEDGYILERIRELFSSERPLEYLDYSNKHDFGYHYKNQYRLCMFSNHLTHQLVDKGMVQNKSLILEYPDIDANLDRHFIRGYFDGDGSFGVYGCNNKLKPQGTINFTSTDNFCKTIQTKLKDNLSISGGGIYDASCHNGITKQLSFGGNTQCKKILDWLYYDTDLYLTRKHDRYINAYYK